MPRANSATVWMMTAMLWGAVVCVHVDLRIFQYHVFSFCNFSSSFLYPKPESLIDVTQVDDEGKVVLLDYNLVHPLPHESHSGGGAAAGASGGAGGSSGDDYGKQPPGSGVQGGHRGTLGRPSITLPAPLEGHSFWGTLEVGGAP